MVLFGLVIVVMGSDDGPEGKYVVSHRYFAQETVLHKEYFKLLSDTRGNLEGCQLPDLKAITGLTLRVDFEKSHKMEVWLTDSTGPRPCFTVDSPLRYIGAKQTILQLKMLAGEHNPIKVELKGLILYEKQHAFDVETDLAISHELVEEIFDKVNTFTEKFNADKAKLGSIYELQQTLANDGHRLELYAADLFRGTRKFQEYMLEALSSHKVMSPENMPKMQKLKSKIDELKSIQKTIFDRFLSIQALLDSRKLLKKSYKKIVALQNTMNSIQQLVADPKFDKLISDSKGILETASSSNIDEILKVFAEMKENVDHTTTFGIGAGLSLLGVVVLAIFGFLIMRKISAVEKAHFG